MLAAVLLLTNAFVTIYIPFRAFAAIAAMNGAGEMNDDEYQAAWRWFMICCLPQALWFCAFLAIAADSRLAHTGAWSISVLVGSAAAILATVIGAMRFEQGPVRRHTRELLAMHGVLIATVALFIYGFGESLGRMH
jgi:hypothetical protein